MAENGKETMDLTESNGNLLISELD